MKKRLRFLQPHAGAVPRRAATPAKGEARGNPVFDIWNSGRDFLSTAANPGPNVNPKTALTFSAWFAAINVLSTDLACLPLKIYRTRKGGGRDEVTDDPRAALLSVSPDGETTATRWRQAWVGQTLGWGNGCAEIAYAGGEVAGLYLIEPGTETQRRSQDRRLYYRLPDGGTLPPYKVLHLAGLGPDGLTGYSVARQARQAIALGISAETFGASFFANGSRPSGALKHPGQLKGQARQNLADSWKEMHSGAGNAGSTPILEEGMDWIPFTIPPDDAQFLSTRQFQVVEVARLFRIPPHKLGDYTQAHLANLAESNQDYCNTTLMPWCVAIENELTYKLLTAAEREKGYYVQHQMNALLRADPAARSAFYTSMFGLAVMTPNIISDLEDMNPIGPMGDERFLTVQAQPLSTMLAPPAPVAPAAPPEKAPPADPVPSGDLPAPADGPGVNLTRDDDGTWEIRFNPNHDPATGKFSSGKGKGGGKGPLPNRVRGDEHAALIAGQTEERRGLAHEVRQDRAEFRADQHAEAKDFDRQQRRDARDHEREQKKEAKDFEKDQAAEAREFERDQRKDAKAFLSDPDNAPDEHPAFHQTQAVDAESFREDQAKARADFREGQAHDAAAFAEQLASERAGFMEDQARHRADHRDEMRERIVAQVEVWRAEQAELLTRLHEEKVDALGAADRGRRYNPYHGKDGKFTSGKGHGGSGGKVVPNPKDVALKDALGELEKYRRDPSSHTDHAAGFVGEVKTSLIKFDPERFQYKLGGQGEHGVTDALHGVKKFDPNLGGILQVWKDPHDQHAYVVNGHHRLDLANKLGADKVAVRFIHAKDAQEARGIGALTNIAEGRGTSLDAAKFFRDTGHTRADLEAKGIPLRERTAHEGLALANLHKPIFDRVVSGELSAARGAIIGDGLDHAQQKEIFSILEKRGKSGSVSDATLRQTVLHARHAPITEVKTFDLFGSNDEHKSLALHRGEASAHVMERLSREKRVFGTVAKEKNAADLEKGGNVIDAATSGKISAQAAQNLDTFNLLQHRSGPVSKLLNEAAERVHKGEKKKAVHDDIYKRLPEAVRQALGGGFAEAA